MSLRRKRRGPSARVRVALLAILASGLIGTAPASAAITFRSASSQTANATNTVTVAAPPDVQLGDIMMASISVGSTALPVAVSTPTGWAAVATQVTQGNLRLATFYRVATASEAASYSFSTSSGSYSFAAGIVDYSGGDTVTLGDSSPTSASGASGNAACPAMTTASANEQVITAAADNNSVTFTPAAGVTERVDAAATKASTEVADFKQATAGTTPAKTATPSATTAPWACVTMAMKAGAGTLAVSTTASPTFSLTLNGINQNASYTAPLSVTDTRTSSLGWNLQITSTQLTKAGGATLATGASTITGVASACNTGSVCTTPTNSLTYPLGVPAGSGPPAAVKFYNASAGTGTGIVTVTPTIQVAVPANAAAGAYTSTLTISQTSGP